MSEKTKTPSDSLAVKFDSLRTGVQKNLLRALGEPLYNILESGELKADILFDIKGKFDIYNNSFNLTKSLGKDYKLSLDYNKRSPKEWGLTFKKEF